MVGIKRNKFDFWLDWVALENVMVLSEKRCSCWNGRVVKASDLNFQTYHLVFHRVGSNPASSELFSQNSTGVFFCFLNSNLKRKIYVVFAAIKYNHELLVPGYSHCPCSGFSSRGSQLDCFL